MKPPSLNKSVLIVDDEKDIRETISEVLELSGYHSTTASGGREALQNLNGHTKPSLILLDLMMPEMDGFEFITAKNLISEIMDIPVVIISADSRAESKLKGLRVAGCLRKPINLDELLETVERYHD